MLIKLSARQEKIISLVKENEPITSAEIASKLDLTRAALRPDLAILTMIGILDAKPKVGYVYSKNPSCIIRDFIINNTVEDIMSEPVVIHEETTVYDAIVHMFLNDTGTLFIENNGFLVGAVSRKDFLKVAIGGMDNHKVPVGVVMTRMPNIVCVEKQDTAYFAAEKIIEHEVDSLPVVERVIDNDIEQLKIVGKVSKTNITKFLVKMGKGS